MKYFLFNHSGCKNHGCEAIVRGTVNILNSADENGQYVLSSYDALSDSILSNVESQQICRKPLNLLEMVIAFVDLKLNKSERYSLKKLYSRLIHQADDCDVCLSIGGDTYCYGDNAGVQVLTECLKKSGKKVVLWARRK